MGRAWGRHLIRLLLGAALTLLVWFLIAPDRADAAERASEPREGQVATVVVAAHGAQSRARGPVVERARRTTESAKHSVRRSVDRLAGSTPVAAVTSRLAQVAPQPKVVPLPKVVAQPEIVPVPEIVPLPAVVSVPRSLPSVPMPRVLALPRPAGRNTVGDRAIASQQAAPGVTSQGVRPEPSPLAPMPPGPLPGAPSPEDPAQCGVPPLGGAHAAYSRAVEPRPVLATRPASWAQPCPWAAWVSRPDSRPD